MGAFSKARGTRSGKPETPTQRLKAVWFGLPEEEKDHWRKQFVSLRKQSDIREELKAQFGIWLPDDSKLTLFRDWVKGQSFCDAHAVRARENEARIMAEHPDWTLEQVRDEVLKLCFFETLAAGDFKLGLKTVAQDVNVRRVSLDEAQVLEAKKEEQAKALEFCLEEAKEYPSVVELFRQAFGALKACKSGAPASLHGSTPLQITNGEGRPPSAVLRQRKRRSAAKPK